MSQEQAALEAEMLLIMRAKEAPDSFVETHVGVKYRDLVPGFASLGRDAAYAIQERTTNIACVAVDQCGPAQGSKGISFLEIITNSGCILICKELKRFFVYKKQCGNEERLFSMAKTLMGAAGWLGRNEPEDRGYINSRANMPYQRLAQELETEHRRAREESFVPPTSFTEQKYHVVELEAYYREKLAQHRAEAAQCAASSRMHAAEVQRESEMGCQIILRYLDRIKSDWTAVSFPKGTEADYEAICEYYANSSLHGYVRCELFKRETPLYSPLDEGVVRGNQQADSEPLIPLDEPVVAPAAAAEPISKENKNWGASSIEQMWLRAKTACQWVKRNAPAVVAGGVTSFAVRAGLHVLFAEHIAQGFGHAGVVAFTLLTGAVAGGFSQLARERFAVVPQEGKKRSRLKVFAYGSALGLVGAVVGHTAAEWLSSHGYLPKLDVFSAGPEAVTSEQVASAPMRPELVVPQATLPVEINPFVPPVEAPPSIDVKDLLTEEQMKKLPRSLRNMALSKSPGKIVAFCKEASYQLLNGPNKSPESTKAGIRLIERGLDVAKASGLHGQVTKMLHADYAFLKAWGIGTDKDLAVAMGHAREAGTAVNKYGPRLIKLFSTFSHG